MAGHPLPTIVIESGWSESLTQLHDDMNLLLIGGHGAINIVILVKWYKNGANVSGVTELYSRDKSERPILRQQEVCYKFLFEAYRILILIQLIFPRPIPSSPQYLQISRRDLFGPALLPGRNGNDRLSIDIEMLRTYAIEALNIMNLSPA